jgi:hypothetical protein
MRIAWSWTTFYNRIKRHDNEQWVIPTAVHTSVVSFFHRLNDKLSIRFHFFNAEQIICSADVAFSDYSRPKQIIIIWATRKIFDCSSMQTGRAIFGTFCVQKSIGRCGCCSIWPMRWKINGQTKLEMVGFQERITDRSWTWISGKSEERHRVLRLSATKIDRKLGEGREARTLNADRFTSSISIISWGDELVAINIEKGVWWQKSNQVWLVIWVWQRTILNMLWNFAYDFDFYAVCRGIWGNVQ